MSDKFTAILSEPNNTIELHDVNVMTIPGSEGELGILKYHAPTMVILKPGIITVFDDQLIRRYFISGGIADIAEEKCIIIVEDLKDIAHLKKDKISSEIEELRSEIRQPSSTNYQVPLIESQQLIQAKLELIKYLTK